MLPFMQALSNVAECFVHSYPNAGLPNAMGGYDETPESFAKSVKLFLDNNIVNALGGCCGTTPEHIQAVDEMITKAKDDGTPFKVSTSGRTASPPTTVRPSRLSVSPLAPLMRSLR